MDQPEETNAVAATANGTTRYFVAVELVDDPEWDVYESMTALLATHGFVGQVTASEGTVCALPAMLYAGESELEAEPLAQQVSAWIGEVLTERSVVFVMEAATWGVQYP
jgi:hypothetical protein